MRDDNGIRLQATKVENLRTSKSEIMSLVNQELDVAQNQSPDSELPIMSKNLINDITANVNEAEHALNKITTGKLSQETDEYIPLSATAYLVSQINDLERRNIQIQQNNVSIESRIEQHEETIRQYTAEMAKLTCLLEASKKLEVIYEKCLKLCGNDEKKATNLIYEVLKDATEKLVDNDTLLKYAEQAKRVRSK